MAENTLTMSTQDASFRPDRKFPPRGCVSTSKGVEEKFLAAVRVSGYESGPKSSYQYMFYPVLVLAFVTSAICLVFILFGISGRRMTDFTEPLMLFVLALNSPGSSRMSGACATGPRGKQLKEQWFVGMDEDREHYYIHNKAEDMEQGGVSMQYVSPKEVPLKGPRVHEYRRLTSKSSLWL